MAPLPARFASARTAARGAPIRATAIERELGTVYTVDTLAALVRRYPKRRFIWLMGADNLAQFHRWRDWRRIAALVPIAVVAVRAMMARALKAPAMGWLRRFVRPAAMARNWTTWRPPALVLLQLAARSDIRHRPSRRRSRLARNSHEIVSTPWPSATA